MMNGRTPEIDSLICRLIIILYINGVSAGLPRNKPSVFLFWSSLQIKLALDEREEKVEFIESELIRDGSSDFISHRP